MGHVEVEPDLDEKLLALTDEYFATQLGPKIARDAQRYCPKNTGALADSIENHLDGHNLIVSATGSDERAYAAYVELGHRIYHPSTGQAGPDVVPPEPFLRPAQYGIPPPPFVHKNANKQLYELAHEQAEHLETGYHKEPHSQPPHLTPAHYTEEPKAIHMAAAVLHETRSRRNALRVMEDAASRYSREYGENSVYTKRARRAAAYIRRISRERQ